MGITTESSQDDVEATLTPASEAPAPTVQPTPPPAAAYTPTPTPPTPEPESVPEPAQSDFLLPTSICLNCQHTGDGSLTACPTRYRHSTINEGGIESARDIRGCSGFSAKGA